MSDTPQAEEINFDGLVGPTHNYGGLSMGNLASMSNYGAVSNPKAAALQGLAKMRRMMELGLPQGVLPPQERPHLKTLRAFGFTGDDATVIETAGKVAPSFLLNCSSASAMWTANAATVSPSADTRDGRVHFTPANLGAMFHRSLEHEQTGRALKAIFADEKHFAHHPALPYGGAMGDEGAANHGRFAATHGAPGAELFIYGRSAFEKLEAPKFLPRQALEASNAIATKHKLTGLHTAFTKQSTAAIDAGAFHNDVVSVTNGNVLFYHEQAFDDLAATQDAIRRACSPVGVEPVFVEVPAERVSLQDAVSSYLFNSQLVNLPCTNGEGSAMALILPTEAEENPATRGFVEEMLASNSSPINKALFLDLKQSMQNGGGPACLRLRVVLTGAERAAASTRCILDEARLTALETWVETHYRDRLAPEDVGDPALYAETCTALDELTRILDLGALYDFQR